MAGLDGPVYVERVALFDAKNRVKAEKAIKKAIRLQVEGKGFSFVEVLAECPTHLKMTPVESEKWVKEKMLPRLPARGEEGRRAGGVAAAAAPELHAGEDDRRDRRLEPSRSSASATASRARAWGDDIGIKLAGAGGDGAQTAALLLARAAINEGFDATHIPSYGPESRGGTSYADVRIAEDEVLSPGGARARTSSWPSTRRASRSSPRTCRREASWSTTARWWRELPPLRPGVKAIGVPFTQIAAEPGEDRS